MTNQMKSPKYRSFILIDSVEELIFFQLEIPDDFDVKRIKRQ